MTVLRMILAGLQLIAFWPVQKKPFDVGYLSIGLTVLATLSVGLGFEALAGHNWQDFSPTVAILQLGRWALIAFLVGGLAAWASRSVTGPAIAAITALSFWTMVATSAINFAVYKFGPQLFGAANNDWRPVFYLAPAGVGLLLLLIGTLRAVPMMLDRRAHAASLSVFGVLAAASLFMPTLPLLRHVAGKEYDHSVLASMAFGYAVEQGWLAVPVRDDSDDPAPPTFDAEAVLGKQPELLDRELTQLIAERPNHRDLYLLGFAGYGWQGVFRREVEAVDKLFAKRFDTQGHSLQLVNSSETIDDLPLAGPHNLDAALQKLGEKMNKDEDVLFLFMTSHGGPGKFTVDMSDMPFHDLTPKALKETLDRSGIKNRVIVLSACYSGSFIKELADDDTLLITAARPDRASFGCADENEWTYFGDALFNHALREAKTFPAAFDTARKLVAEWEKTQGVVPSEPQISIGRRIEATLAGLTVGPPDRAEFAQRR